MLFSATMPGPIVALARSFLNQPLQIRAESDVVHTSTNHIDQFAYRAHAMDKVELLSRVLQARNRGLTLIFVRTKRSAAKIADDLSDRGFAVAAVHGDLGQGAREQALRAFRSGKVDVLVATDVAARGLDVEGITHVINYQAPEDEMTYVHRIGRTARAGASGTAITLVDWDDLPQWKLVCDKLDLPFHAPVETYSTSSHLYLELDIPSDVTGVLPRAERTRAGLGAEAVEDLGGREPRGSRDRRGRPERPQERPRERRTDRPAGEARDRRRTRGGRSVDEASPGAATEAGGSAASSAPAGTGADTAPPTGPTTAPGSGESNGAPRRRRRRRRGAGERPASD
jgi:superfamily II DNA/RNA helicase